jgi:hypothetical protein
MSSLLSIADLRVAFRMEREGGAVRRVEAVKGVSPHISRTPVKTRTAFPLECPLVLVLKRNQRAGNAEAKL